MKPLIQKYIGSAVRHALTLGAGWLAAKGVIEISNDQVTSLSGTLTEIATAAAMFLIAQGWSLLEKKAK